jgi:hypothetical protein
MFFSSRSLLALGFSLSAGCASHSYDAKVASSADGAGYALRYVDDLDSATKAFAADKQRAHDLTSSLPARARDVKPGGDRSLLLRIVEESDRAGRAESYARTQSEERALRAFWEDERGPLSARVAGAAQKDVLDAGCTQQVELGGSVQHALRDGLDKQLERRTRAANEGQRTLEQHKARLAAGTLPAVQRLSDEIALTSHLVHVALVSDVRELERLLGERRDVDATLGRMLEDERATQADPHKPSEQKASQERVVQIEKSRAALTPKVAEAEAGLRDHEEQLRLAQEEYEKTSEAIKASFRGEPEPAAQPVAATVKP